VLLDVYLIFNEGCTATSGEEWMRAALSEEALVSDACWRSLLSLEDAVDTVANPPDVTAWLAVKMSSRVSSSIT
jgi:predicted RNA polymerase sigma factor